jgi:uncharacterized protein YlxP (DUF503 family)
LGVDVRVALLHVELHIPYAPSLKDKRMVLRCLSTFDFRLSTFDF